MCGCTLISPRAKHVWFGHFYRYTFPPWAPTHHNTPSNPSLSHHCRPAAALHPEVLVLLTAPGSAPLPVASQQRDALCTASHIAASVAGGKLILKKENTSYHSPSTWIYIEYIILLYLIKAQEKNNLRFQLLSLHFPHWTLKRNNCQHAHFW